MWGLIKLISNKIINIGILIELITLGILLFILRRKIEKDTAENDNK